MEELLRVPSCHRAHLSSIGRGEVSSQFVVDEIYEMIIDNLSYEPRSIIRYIKYKYDVTYRKA
jgi:hypothetical protein